MSIRLFTFSALYYNVAKEMRKMLIGCTKKLLDEMNIEPEGREAEEPLFDWHANLLVIGRRKTIVLVNDSNRYVVVLYGLREKDFKQLEKLIPMAIRNTFKEECIKEEVINSYIESAGRITLTKTKDRTLVARMNKGCEIVQYFEDDINSGEMFQTGLSKWVSRTLVGDSTGNFFHPNDEMYKDLEAFAGEPVIQCIAAVFRVDLELENQKVWRRLAVPLSKTFLEFHKILQKAFGWNDSHLHEFFADEMDIKLNEDKKLSEYIPAYEYLKYNYDFGDNWQHYINVESLIEDYDKNYSICLGGDGIAPLEDVGGEAGYEEFLRIMSDQTSPEYKDTAAWAHSQGYGEFDIESLNRFLKYID
jgi:hypothetical protein